VAEAAETTAAVATQPIKPDYGRLTRSDVGVLLKLHKDGLTQDQIAHRLGCSQPTVAKWLSDLIDTTEPSKAYLRGSALRMAQNIVRKGLPRDHVQALKGLGVLEETQQQGFTVNIGISDSVVQVQVLTPVAKVAE
jgi:hypothetical protein